MRLSGLISFLVFFVTIAVIMYRSGFRWSHVRFKKADGSRVERAPALAASLLVAVLMIGYFFVRKVFPQVLPPWVKTAELSIFAVFVAALIVFILWLRRQEKAAREEWVKHEALRPKFDDEIGHRLQAKDETP